MLQPAILALQNKIGRSIGSSPWLLIDQARIDAFARATDDLDPMHVDSEWCAAHSPFKTTIAFGFLTLSMLTSFSHQALGWINSTAADDGGYALNYGFDRVRLIEPVPVGSRIRAHFTLLEWNEVRPGEVRCKYGVTVEVEGQPRPALAAEWLGLWVSGEGHRRIEAKQNSQ